MSAHVFIIAFKVQPEQSEGKYLLWPDIGLVNGRSDNKSSRPLQPYDTRGKGVGKLKKAVRLLRPDGLNSYGTAKRFRRR